MFKKNVEGIERVIRFVAGAALIAYGLIGLQGMIIGYILIALGTISALSGLFGFCAVYAIAGRKVC